jgi:hypothetical protein
MFILFVYSICVSVANVNEGELKSSVMVSLKIFCERQPLNTLRCKADFSNPRMSIHNAVIF